MITLAVPISHNLSSLPSPNGVCSRAQVWVMAQPFHPPGTPLWVSERHLVILNVCPQGRRNRGAKLIISYDCLFFPTHIETEFFSDHHTPQPLQIQTQSGDNYMIFKFKTWGGKAAGGQVILLVINRTHFTGKTIRYISTRSNMKHWSELINKNGVSNHIKKGCRSVWDLLRVECWRKCG